MRSTLIAIGVASAGMLVATSFRVNAEDVKPRTLDELSVANQLQTIKQAGLLRINQPYVVDGLTRFNGWFIVADKVVFKSGSQLVFTKQALDGRRNFFIVAKELISEDNNSPGQITYERPNSLPASSTPGQAASGAQGAGDGSSGRQGATGNPGVNGDKGFSAPAITLTLLSVPNSGPSIDFRGAQGGEGGQGQKGGDGGAGAKGSPASQSMFDCKAGGGDGGAGGTGGTGGPGGMGGAGGDGGTVTIISPSDLLPSLTQKFRVQVAAGQGGKGGAPGVGGNGGAGGPGGQDARPYCGGGSGGPGGRTGGPGQPGATGPTGIDGDLFVGAITPALFAQVFGN